MTVAPVRDRRARAVIVLVVGVVVLAGAALIATAVGGSAVGAGQHRPAALVVALIAGLVAVAGGGPIALAVLQLADPQVRDPGLLHGGAWVGALERAAVAASLLAGWPEGIAVCLAVKGLGRYPELRAPAAAERFIIGTFASVLWAGGCAGVGLLLLA
jgi:hypothetical protein